MAGIIKPFEFTKSSDLVAHKKQQLNDMLQNQDPNVQRMGQSQAVISALFGDKSVKNAIKLETVINNGMNLSQEEDEDSLDYQKRQQEYIRSEAAGLDPNIALQANGNIMTLMKEKKAQMKLQAADARTLEKHNMDMAEERRAQTPTIVRYDPTTGQKQVVKTGEVGDVMGLNDEMNALNEAGDGYTYGISNANDSLTPTDPNEVMGPGDHVGKTEGRRLRDSFENQTKAMHAALPLLNQLASNPRALEGVFMDKQGKVQGGPVSRIFGEIEYYGRQAMKGYETMFADGKGETESGESFEINDYVSERMRQEGIEGAVAEARVVALAYAIAKSRDSGRLSDQDVALAMRSLTGQGGVRELALLFRDIHRSARHEQELAIDRVYGADYHLPETMRKKAQSVSTEMEELLERMDLRADELGQPTTRAKEREAMLAQQEANRTSVAAANPDNAPVQYTPEQQKEYTTGIQTKWGSTSWPTN
jgi:hypothetical protein